MDIPVTNVFERNRENHSTVLINRGGARSSKSYSIMQILVERFFTCPERRILILRKTLPSLRISTIQVIDRYIDWLGLSSRVKKIRLTLDYINILNGAVIHFGSLDDPEKIKSTEWHDIWMEEATEFTFDDYMAVETRLSLPPQGRVPNQLFLSFNPISQYHWIKERLLTSSRDMAEIPSSYRDNPFLPEDYVRRLQALEYEDENYYRIYTLGEWGVLEGTVFTNWDVVQHMPSDGIDEVIYGLDFGFVNPTALVKVGIRENDIWVEELLYETMLTNDRLIDKLALLIPDRNATIYCDSSEKDRIQELRNAGFNVAESEKGAGSVKAGIDYIRSKRLHITSKSVNAIKEIQCYCWKKDRRTDGYIDEPVKWNDHLMDAMRYALYTHSRSGEMAVRWL